MGQGTAAASGTDAPGRRFYAAERLSDMPRCKPAMSSFVLDGSLPVDRGEMSIGMNRLPPPAACVQGRIFEGSAGSANEG